MSAASDPVIIQTCTSCSALIDISDEEPFAAIHCPACGMAQRVRRNFDHFELQEELGAGGMGKVYRALDTKLNRPVALKVLRKEYSADQSFVAQFEKEASITASINHPHVVKVYSTGRDAVAPLRSIHERPCDSEPDAGLGAGATRARSWPAYGRRTAGA